jgi:hypothetical protein
MRRHQQQQFRGSLFSQSGSRKYLNARERQRFVDAARRKPSNIRLFCLTLRYDRAADPINSCRMLGFFKRYRERQRMAAVDAAVLIAQFGDQRPPP